jgi:hypothetical protein
MKRLFTLLLSFISLNSFAQLTSSEVHSNNPNSFHLSFTNGEIDLGTLENKEGLFTEIHIDGLTKSYDLGNPDLPVFSKLIEIPEDGEIVVSILNKETSIIDLSELGYHYEVLPAQRSVFKNEDVNKIRFIYNEATYSADQFYRQSVVNIERLGTMRGKTIARLQIAPLAYHPLTNEIEKIEELNIKVQFTSSIKQENPSLQSSEFGANFSKLLNTQTPLKNDFTIAPIRMVILSDPMFEDALQDFISWKTRKGFDVIEVYKGDENLGSTPESMKAYIQSLYDNATELEPAPTYLLIVGDHEQIPSFNTGSHVSDMYYCEFDGAGDYFPEMYYGRFSANNISELAPQLEKTIQYEAYTMSDPSYLAEALMVAGVDASFAPTHGNGQINYGIDNYFNTDHDITTYTYLYPESATSVAETEIIERISNGVGFGNYTAHCGPTGWSDPSFDIYNVSTLENEDQYGLLIGNCCQSNTFNGVTCLGEALLRAAKKGAVGYIGGSNNTLWDEDYYWGVGNGPISANPTYEETSVAAYDCSFHENEELEELWTISQGQILQAGNWAVSESGSWNSQYYWEIYHLMGDPTVLTYYGIPSVIEVAHAAAITMGTSSINVSTEQYAYVAINQDGVLLDASYTDASGTVLLNFDPISSMEPVEIVVSKQNRQVYISDINMMSADAPFVAFSQLTINDGVGGNAQAEVGESFTLNIDLQNFGMVDAGTIEMSVSSSNSNVSVSSESSTVEGLSAESTTTIPDAVTIQLNGLFEDQEVVVLTFTVIDVEGIQWITYGSFVVNAPSLNFSSHTLSDEDGNGFIDFGETVQLNMSLENNGHANSLAGLALTSTDFTSLQIIEESITFNPIDDGATIEISIPMTLDADAPAGEEYEVHIVATTDGNYTAEYTVLFTSSNCSTGAMEVQLFLATDYYSEEVAWNMTSSDGSVLGSAALGSLSSETNYEEFFCLENNSYLTFEIIDDYGDGLFTDGYSIVVCGQTIASGSDYGFGETISFIAGCDQTLAIGCTNPDFPNYDENAIVDDGSCQEIGIEEIVNTIVLFPNPADQSVFINTGYLDVKMISVMDLTGKKILAIHSTDETIELNIEKLQSGTYLLRIELADGLLVTKSLVVL